MYRPSHGIRLECSARSDRGRVRQNNEDNVHLWQSERSLLAVVADGMGGAVAGEEASRIAVKTIHDKLVTDTYRSPDDYHNYDEDALADLLGEAVVEANENIIQRAVEAPELSGMGTTVTLVFARNGVVTLAHVGDSRAYYIDAAAMTIHQLTTDHSFVQALVDAGHITLEEAERHPMKNVLVRALGQAPDLKVDLEPHVNLHVGDRLVLCSDGLTLHLSADEIRDIVMSANDPNVISEQLVKLANERGGKDNVSVIVIIAELSEQTDLSAYGLADQDIDIGDDDEPTLPINPDYLNVTRVHQKIDQPPQDDPQSTQEMQFAGTYGEGRDYSDHLF